MNRFVASLRIFISGAWLSYVGLFHWTDPASYVASIVLAPMTYMLFFMYLGTSATGSGTADFYLVGNALTMAAVNGIFGVTMAVGNERNFGTLLYLLGSPANRLAIFLGRAFFNVLNGFVTVTICFGWAFLLGLDLHRADLAGLALVIVVVTFSTSGLGLLIGSISLMTLNVMFVNNTIFFVLLVFSGANLPLAQMPGWIQWGGAVLPMTRGIQAARGLVAGQSIAQVWPLLAWEVAIGAVFALAGYAVFAWFESQARRLGTLEGF